MNTDDYVRFVDQAACRGANDEAWGELETRRHADQIADQLAKAQLAERFCAGCPVIEICGQLADRNRYLGLWGGSHRTGHGKDYTATPLIPNPPARVPYQPRLRSAS